MIETGLSEENWAYCRELVEGSTRIRARSTSLIRSLQMVFEEPAPMAHVGMTFVPDEAGGAEITTPISRGRLRLAFDNSADDGLVGKLLVEKSVFDEYDRPVWRTVWSILVPKYGDPVTGGGKGHVIELDSHFGERRANSLFNAGMGIAAALT